MPLLRLGLFVIGRLSHWDWQAIHYATLALMGMGALALLCAARSIRGHSSLSDTFLCLLVLSPWQYETTWVYGYSFGAAGGLTCIALSMVAARLPQRSPKHLVFYLLTVLAITLTGGPTGNLVALGLAGALTPYFRETTSRTWKLSAVFGIGLVVAASGLLLALMPSEPHHAKFLSNSLITTVKATLKESVCWLSRPVLQVLWPWAFLILLLPGLWVAVQIVRDLLRWRRGSLALGREWIDLLLVWLATFLVAASIAYGRARLELWASRYTVLTMPIGIVLYLLLVRMQAPAAIPHTLAVLMAVFCGWCWPFILARETEHRVRMTQLVRSLAQGDVPLSEVGMRHSIDVGFPPELAWHSHLTNWIMELRQNDQSIFRAINRRKQRAGVALPQAWKADSGKLGEGWACLSETYATQGRAMRVSATREQPASVVYHVQVAVGGVYQLCCRMRAPQPPTLTVTVDGSQYQRQTFSASADFLPYVLAYPLKLGPGQHDLTLALSPAHSELDLLELVPQSPTNAR